VCIDTLCYNTSIYLNKVFALLKEIEVFLAILLNVDRRKMMILPPVDRRSFVFEKEVEHTVSFKTLTHLLTYKKSLIYYQTRVFQFGCIPGSSQK
jgi:hypothetical protein